MSTAIRLSHLIFFLTARLDFVKYFYTSTAPVFAEIKRKIEEHEDPFDYAHLEEHGEDGFQGEWEEADGALDVLGMTCLTLLQRDLHAFLSTFLIELGGQSLKDHVSQMSGEGWFAKYRNLCSELDLGLDWEASGADLRLLEEMVLTRNDYLHAGELWESYLYQGKRHAKKYPDSSFKYKYWPPMPLFGHRLVVVQDHLDEVSAQILKLCSFLEKIRDGKRFKFELTSRPNLPRRS